jgi:hypothetical protein
MTLLTLPPNLTECTLNSLSTEGDYSRERVVLRSLRCLKFGGAIDLRRLNGDDDFIRHLTLPALQTLVLPFHDITSTEFSLFLDRSSPPLQKLVLGVDTVSKFDSYGIAGCLRLIPSLTYVELFAGPPVLNDFLSFADTPSLLQNLRTLKLQHDMAVFSDALSRLLFRTLSRATPLLSFYEHARRAPAWARYL